MHIPDGYLSPSTCAATLAVAAPFWYLALGKMKALLQTRLVPLIGLVAAFSFLVMMFNLPLPGGTSGHAVGLAIAPILLGPWAAMLALSLALFIQAIFFGDGGITTFGANCLNLAIVGPWVAYGIYRVLAGSAPLESPRRVLAAALAGYGAINVAALLTGLELGVQPLWFQDASGTPLYAPYPLHIAVPAMLAGHLTIAGLAEALISGGLVAYVQKSHPELLSTPVTALDGAAQGWRSTRSLWALIGGLLVASPLGLLATGIAWGEWSLDDWQDPVTRQLITQASGNQAPPEGIPQGLEWLSQLWSAPIPDYAPEFLHNPYLGYLLSAMLGVGLVVLTLLALSRLAARLGRAHR